MSNIYIYTYNNYFNRIVKKESSLANYGTPEYVLTKANFDYADGVSTSHVFNYNGNGDYLIVTDAENNILHRWFVIENKKTRGGQYRFILRRDLFVDFYDLIVNAPMIMNKGWLNKNSPLLFNPEEGSYNQIKKEETLLQDASKEPWYVVYFAKNTPATSGKTFGIGSSDRVIVDTVNTPIDESIYQARSINAYSNIKYIINAQDSRYISGSTPPYSTIKMNVISGGVDYNIYSRYALDNDYIWFQASIGFIEVELAEAFRNKFNNIHSLDTDYTSDETDANIAKIMAANGKYVKDNNNNVYKISVSKTSSNYENYNLNQNVTDYMKGIITNNTQLSPEGS